MRWRWGGPLLALLVTIALGACAGGSTAARSGGGFRVGLVTEVTCGARAKGASALVTRARTAGEPIGSVEWIASVSVSPDRWWKCWLSRV